MLLVALQPPAIEQSEYDHDAQRNHSRARLPRTHRRTACHSQTIFDEFRDKDLKPAYLADADPNRALLDKRVVCDLLGFDHDTYEAVRRLSAKWCAEPSVHGGKARPRSAKLVI